MSLAEQLIDELVHSMSEDADDDYEDLVKDVSSTAIAIAKRSKGFVKVAMHNAKNGSVVLAFEDKSSADEYLKLARSRVRGAKNFSTSSSGGKYTVEIGVGPRPKVAKPEPVSDHQEIVDLGKGFDGKPRWKGAKTLIVSFSDSAVGSGFASNVNSFPSVLSAVNTPSGRTSGSKVTVIMKSPGSMPKPSKGIKGHKRSPGPPRRRRRR